MQHMLHVCMYWQLYYFVREYMYTVLSVLAQVMITRRGEELCNVCLLERFVPGAFRALNAGEFGGTTYTPTLPA